VTRVVLGLGVIWLAAGALSAAQRSNEPPAEGEWTGRLDYGVVAVGGETTGIVLTTESGRFELEPADTAMRNHMKGLNGKQVVVRGLLRTVAGVEVKERHIIKVTSITAKATSI
jgi:hypothetical protein